MTITLSIIIWWILIGLVVGAVARLVIPGRQHIGIIVTILIGIVAAIVGGILTAAVLGAGHTIITFIVAVLLAVSVSVLVPVVGFGLSTAVTPLGKPDAASVTLPLNPPASVTVMVLVPPTPP